MSAARFRCDGLVSARCKLTDPNVDTANSEPALMRIPKYTRWNLLGVVLFVAVLFGGLALQFAGNDAERAYAATGVIDALNVGTCLATDEDVFEDEPCDLSDRSGDWEIRDEVEEVSTLYATYAHDPKTGWDEPRAIFEDSDLLKVSVFDPGRDKRSAVLVRGEGHSEVAGGLAEIRSLLVNGDLIDSDVDVDFESGTRLIVRGSSGSAAIDVSGSHTLNMDGGSSYHPMDVDGNIRFFGCVTSAKSCVLDSANDDELYDITSSLRVDEDKSSGSTSPSIAPWLIVNAGVPADKSVVIYAMYYETSDREEMGGGSTYRHCGSGSNEPDRESNDVWRCGSSEADERDGHGDVVYTDDEVDGNDELLLRVRSDGDEAYVNLYLTETGLFTGRYEGYIRLTDANGDGTEIDESGPSEDWGVKVRDGDSGSRESDAAVIGVASGPVTVEYRDSGGRRRTLRIAIDYEPPRIDIDTPRHLSASDDHSPDFIGSFEDYDSGLASDSFRLVVDNDADSSINSDFALDGIAPSAHVRGSGTNGSVSRRADYIGYSTSGDDPFGVVEPRQLYDLGDDSCGRAQDTCYILADRYSDGASSARFDDSLRLRLDGDELEYGIDFQAFVADRAGNVGFSDSDPGNPYFINNLGVEDPKERNEPNVLGYYSAHIVGLDEKDPEVSTTRSATGYYGVDIDERPVPDRRGVMVVFDGPIAASSVSLDTFYVELDDGSEAEVVDVMVYEQYVFLKLRHELASDATPFVGIAAGESVRDNAGNITSGRELRRFEANDGISPHLTVTLSGGSGRGEGAEGPSQLTNEAINVRVESDELLQGAPRIVVVCEDLNWEETIRGRKIEYDVDDFIANRDGAFNGKPQEDSGTRYMCGSGDDAEPFQFQEMSGNARPGELWEVEWWNSRSGSSRLEDGQVRVVAFARDRSRHVRDGEYVQSWGAASATFGLDTSFESPLKPSGGNVHPGDASEVSEPRPFIIIEFVESTTVTLDSVTLDGVQIAEDFQNPDMNRFVYWPLSMMRGAHEIEVEATDAAGNPVEFDFEFESTERGDFVLNLASGWNAISLPADPIDTRIDAVFTDPAIQAVVGWDTDGWRVAMRRNGVWESSHSFGTLPSVGARYGYWVKSSGFVLQRVKLRGPTYLIDGAIPNLIDIATNSGWNFVGVIDADGDQTEGHFGVTLRDSQDVPVTAEEYLGESYVRAYTWDATFSRFDVLRPADPMTIGDGVWVYYSDGTGIAP